MRIIIDARSFNRGGIGTTLLGILENLDYTANEYALVGDRDILSKLNLPCKIINTKSKPHSFWAYINHNLSKIINEYDCYFTPNQIIPRGIKINSYFILHDTDFIDTKKIDRTPLINYLKRKVAIRSCRFAKKIFTVSSFSKSRIENYFGSNKEVIIINQGLTESIIDNKLEKENIKKENYVVYVGGLEKHKNIDTLLKAITLLNGKYDLHFLLQRRRIFHHEKKVLKKLQNIPHVKLLFDLSPSEYAKEISNARALVNPSLYEGFATPILESIYYGTKAIVSDIPIYHEIFSKGQVNYFEPTNANALADLIDSDNLTIKSFNKGFKEKYNYLNCVNQIVSSFTKKRSNHRLQLNFVFNVIYQLLVVATPLILTPYVSRVLGAASIGQFSFAYTLAYYFVIAGSLGFQQYAQRAIAEAQKDKEEQSRVFWQLFIVRLLPVSISLGVLFILYGSGVFGEYSSLVLFLSILVAGTAFDINYYFHGKENFLSVMAINLVIRLVFLISIFSFVKSRNDLGLYTLLYSLMVFGSYLSMWFALPMNLRRVKLKTLNFKKHMKSSLSLFLPVAAVSIYAILDKTLIGALIHGQTYQKIGYITIIVNISDLENGYYYETERLIKAILSIILAIGTVMSTRNSIEYSNKHSGAIKKNIYRSFRFVFCLGIPLAFGAMAVANPFVPLFYGEGYEKTAILIMIYAPVILIVGCSNILGLQYLLPTKRDKQYSISVLIGFVLNIAFNCLLIPFLGSIGAVVGTIISEFFIVLVQYIFVRKEISLKIIGLIIYKYVIAGLLMLAACFLFYYLILINTRTSNFVRVISLIPIGAVIYYGSLILLKDKFVFEYTKILFTRIKKGIIYAKQRVLNQSKTALALLTLNSKTRQVKEKELPININNNNGK